MNENRISNPTTRWESFRTTIGEIIHAVIAFCRCCFPCCPKEENYVANRSEEDGCSSSNTAIAKRVVTPATDGLQSAAEQTEGTLYNSKGQQLGTYQARTLAKKENTVEVTLCENKKTKKKVTISYGYVEKLPIKTIFDKLRKTYNIRSDAISFEQLKGKIATRTASTEQLAPVRLVKGDAAKQLQTIEGSKQSKDRIVVINASQLNYQEQLSPEHDIRKNIAGVHLDPTFGPAIVKTQPGGVEFISHTLGAPGQAEFEGAFHDFFIQCKKDRYRISAQGGYYSSNLTKQDWLNLYRKLTNTPSMVKNFFWNKENGTVVYQTGAINSANARRDYAYLHENACPPVEMEFAILFTQFYNVLCHECQQTEDQLVIHTTRIGEGVFGNTPNVSMYALFAALNCLTEEQRSKISVVNLGTYGQEEHGRLVALMNSFGITNLDQIHCS